MFSRTLPDHGPSKRKRALLAGGGASERNSISSLLSTMGWACTTTAGLQDVLPMIERDSYDAVLLDLSCSAGSAERTIRRIKEMRPSLSERIVVITCVAPDPEILELIERYDLPQLSHDNVLSRLWSTLEDLVVSPASFKVAPRNIQTARLLFDSFHMARPAGMRSSGMSGRHFTYEHNNNTIDILVDVKEGSSRISLVGQVLDSKTRGKCDSLTVVLSGGNGTLARTATNYLGEFNLEFESADNLSLDIRIGERSWVSIPLQPMNWTKKRLPNRATGT
jgi:CheY-like chemotaxis protein